MLTVGIGNVQYEPAMRSVNPEPVDHVQGEKIDESISELTRHRAEDGTSILIDRHLAHVHELLREPERDFPVPRVLANTGRPVTEWSHPKMRILFITAYCTLAGRRAWACWQLSFPLAFFRRLCLSSLRVFVSF